MNRPVRHEEYQAEHSQYEAQYKDKGFFIKGSRIRDARLSKCFKILQDMPVGKLLDIGGGSGQFSAHLKHESIVMDISRDVLKAKQGCLGSASDVFPFKDRCFDYVFAGEIIEHIIDTDSFLDECWRVLKKQGVFIVTAPNMASLANRFLLLAGKQPIWVDFRCAGAGHVRSYTAGALMNQIRNHNFEITKISGSWVQPSKLFRDFGVWLGSVFPSLSAHIIVVCEKTEK